MEELKQRLLKLIQSMEVDTEQKRLVTEQVSTEGVGKDVVNRVRDLLDVAIVEFEKKTNDQISELQKQLDTTIKSFEDEMITIERLGKEALKDQQKQQDLDKMEQVRKSIQGLQ